MTKLNAVEDQLRVYPSRASFEPVPTDEVQRLYFRTSTGTQFVQEGAPEDARCENFVDVHGIGQRTGKYLPYQKKRAPLFDRSSVAYYRDFIALPLDDAPITKALAKANKLRSNPQDKSVSMAKLDGSTRYREQFTAPTRKEAKGAKQKNCKPKAALTHTLPTGKLLEKRSFSHTVFEPPPQQFKSQPAKPPMPNLFLLDRYGPISTAYQEEFTDPALQRSPPASPTFSRASTRTPSNVSAQPTTKKRPERCSSAPAGGRRDKQQHESLRDKIQRPSSAVAKLQSMLCRDEDIYKVRRACYVTPGQ
eukprot:TRINITY_DN102398_c0_g1_i1.p1 TRINITY_DN102398_c0_g1~~TRINITY_DN102398_c0_g1_i1.p1  ORF type:complete len:306 (+),score=62.59 TRINITY_DN102398_c0_g1_i1:104-1021(+)